jgi:hypothetical protein
MEGMPLNGPKTLYPAGNVLAKGAWCREQGVIPNLTGSLRYVVKVER